MNNNDLEINEKEKEESSNLSSEEINEKIIYSNKMNNIDKNEREFNININNNNECELYLSTNSFESESLENQIDIKNISKEEIISIKEFRNLLGILGNKSTNFIIERLYQALLRISSKKNQHINSHLIKNDFLNFLSIINDSKIHHEIFYLFFDISNKGYITKNDFINVISNMCETICEFTNHNPAIYKNNITILYDQLLQKNMKSLGGKNNNQQWISKSSFIKLIKSGAINFYDIMNAKKGEKNIYITQKQYKILNDIMYSFNDMKKKIMQKENIESNLSIITDNYLDNIDVMKNEYKEMQTQNEIINNSFSLYNASSFMDKSKIYQNSYEQINFNNISKIISYNKINNFQTKQFYNLNINKNSNNLNNIKENFFDNNQLKNKLINKNDIFNIPKINSIEMKSPQERLQSNKVIDNSPDSEDIQEESLNSLELEGKEESEKDEELNYKLFNEENEDSVNEMDNKSIKNIQNIKKLKTKISCSFDNPLIKNKNKNFFFLKPFRIKNDKELEKDLSKHNIDINNTLILLRKDNYLSYLETLENVFNKEIKEINSNNCVSNMDKNEKTSIILNKPLKEKEIYEKEKSFEYTLNNINIELMLAITFGIEKCIISLGDYDLMDKEIIISLQSEGIYKKTTRKRNNTLFLAKFDKIEKKHSELYEAISNYPFKTNQFIYEEINTFHYSFFSLDKKDDKTININKIEISEYAPKLFCNIRYNFGEITNKDFLHSFNIESLISNILLGNINNLNQLLTLNKENYLEFIMFSMDAKYIIKCINQNEFEALQKILPNYYEYLMSCMELNLQKSNLEFQRSNTFVSTFSSSGFNQINNNEESKCTLVDIIYGAYSIKLLDKQFFFIIKKNIFYSYNNLLIYKKYDLKGSSIDRKTSKNKISDVYKDLDYLQFEEKINLPEKISNYLSEILEKDTLFLSQNNIINYSFYIGIAKIPQSFENEENEEGFLSLDKNVIYYFGISDIFTEFGAGKKMEHIFKKLTKGSGFSAVPPSEYKKRFDNFIKFCLK